MVPIAQPLFLKIGYKEQPINFVRKCMTAIDNLIVGSFSVDPFG